MTYENKPDYTIFKTNFGHHFNSIYMKKSLLSLCISILFFFSAVSQNNYLGPTDTLVKKNLEKWRDLKFGMIIHWGLYSQLGVVESWGLCSEDQSFQDRGGMNYEDYKKMYFGQISKFNPVNFNPEQWAEAGENAGMKYVVFTTKHHDGFCMFDTKETDFKITSTQSPFHANHRANVALHVFNAFRLKKFMIGAYFSKPDWHCPNYWTPLLATPDRNNNYDIRKYPERWRAFQDYTFNQINELTTNYGRVDILWLDGGWVRPDSTITEEVRSWGYRIPEWNPDINMPGIAKMARKNQPGILIVDRTVHGPYEDYRTPEQSVPDSILPYPWETCMTMTSNWGYVYNAEYKPLPYLVNTLVDVVSKGGNFLLDVAPSPDGTLDQEAIDRLNGIGAWLKINGEAIYGTRPWTTYGEGQNVRYTRSGNGKILYVFIFNYHENEILLSHFQTTKKKKVVLLSSGQQIDSSVKDGRLILEFPDSVVKNGKAPLSLPLVVKIEL